MLKAYLQYATSVLRHQRRARAGCLRVAPACAATVPPAMPWPYQSHLPPVQAYYEKCPLKFPLRFLLKPKPVAHPTPQLPAMNNPKSNKTYKPNQALAKLFQVHRTAVETVLSCSSISSSPGRWV